MQAAYDAYKRTLDAIVAKYDKQQAILAAGGTLADFNDDGESQLQLSNGSVTAAKVTASTGSDGSQRVVLTDSQGNEYRDWGAEGTDVETLIEELRLEQEVCSSVLLTSIVLFRLLSLVSIRSVEAKDAWCDYVVPHILYASTVTWWHISVVKCSVV
jgi:hypothetical protein